MSKEERSEDAQPDDPPAETPHEEHDLEEAIHALAPEDDLETNESAKDFGEEDFEAKLQDTALATSQNKPEPRNRGRGFFDFLIVLVLAGLGIGEYLLIEKQKAQQAFLADRLTTIEQDIKTLKNRKPTAAQPSKKMQTALNDLTAQIRGLKEQINTTRNQQEQTTNWVKGEMEKLKSTPVAAAPVQAEPEQEAEEAEPESHESESGNPAEGFIEFVENIGGIVINGIKDGAIFVWDKIGDLIDSGDDSPPTATPASNK